MPATERTSVDPDQDARPGTGASGGPLPRRQPGHSRRLNPRDKPLHVAPDPDARPQRLPAPWDALSWSQIAPTRHDRKARLFGATRAEDAVVCKDFSRPMRRPLARYPRKLLLRNEVRALRRLEGLPGVPPLLAVWPTGFVMGRVPGTRLSDLERGSVPTAVFDELDRLVASIHARGVIIGDLHRRNILVDDALRVHLVDFEMALVADAGVGRLARRQLLAMDRLAAARQRDQHGRPLSADQQELLARPPLLRRMLASFKQGRRRLLGRSSSKR
jgi:hypothetical protein